MLRLDRLAVLALASCGYSTYYPHPIVGITDDTGVVDEVPCGFAGSTVVSLTLFSSIADPLQVYAVDPASCSEVYQTTLVSGGSELLSTVSGVTWVSRASNGALLGYFTVPDGATEWTEYVP